MQNLWYTRIAIRIPPIQYHLPFHQRPLVGHHSPHVSPRVLLPSFVHNAPVPLRIMPILYQIVGTLTAMRGHLSLPVE
jgi:hypothetical protein